MSKRICLALSVFIVVYGIMLLQQNLGTLNTSARERPLLGAVNIAFGQIKFFSQHKKYSVPASLLKQCQFKMLHDNVSIDEGCLLLSPDTKSYYDECAWWRFENCAVLRPDPIFLKDKVLLAQLENVLAKPCEYLPDKGMNEKEKARARAEQYLSATSPLDQYVLQVIDSYYSDYSKNMNCGQRGKKLRVVLLFKKGKPYQYQGEPVVRQIISNTGV